MRQIIRVWFQKIGIKISAVRFQKCVLKKTRCGFCENGFYDNSDRKAIQVPTFELTATELNSVRANYHCPFSVEGILPFP